MVQTRDARLRQASYDNRFI